MVRHVYSDRHVQVADNALVQSSSSSIEQRVKLCPAIENIIRTGACPPTDLAVLSVEEQIGFSQAESDTTYHLWLTDGALKIRGMIHEANTKPPEKETVICLQDYQLQCQRNTYFLAISNYVYVGRIENPKQKIDSTEAAAPKTQLSRQLVASSTLVESASASTGPPSTPLKLWTLQDLITQKRGSYNFVCDVVGVIVSLSPVRFSKLGTKRDLMIIDHTCPKEFENGVLMSTFVDPQNFSPPLGTIALFRGLKTHTYQGISLNSYKKDNEDKEWFITGEERLRDMCPTIDYDRLRQVWREARWERKR